MTFLEFHFEKLFDKENWDLNLMRFHFGRLFSKTVPYGTSHFLNILELIFSEQL